MEGPSGSGRTCLLLALTGRMRPTEGQAAVGGLELPRRMAAVRRVSALAHVAGVTELDPALTVGEHLREQALLQRRFGDAPRRLLPRPRAVRAREERERVDTALAAAGLDPESLPKGERTAVRDLERVEALRLSLALALLGRPRLLGVDDVDLKLPPAERVVVWDLLRSVAAAGTTVLAVCSEAPRDAVTVRTGTGPHDEDQQHDGEHGQDRHDDDKHNHDKHHHGEHDGHDGHDEHDDDKHEEHEEHEEKEDADALAATGRS
ncbi:ABC-type multidrug transport system ATPase subunit [Streptomyces calvus]|uniref:ABC-type multidrug transport system ATPase subunit n=1 Tax=Streptomyces calvus TaxID=67282 RepID=A0AA40SBC3_9ACTN|nr:ABC-type multidrug transport system ATPase subunit [Streptomyces calvus]